MDEDDIGGVLTEIQEGQATIKVGVEQIRTNDIERAAQLQSVDQRLSVVEQGIIGKVVTLPGLEDEKQKFHFAKAFRSMLLEKLPNTSQDEAWRGAGFEREVFDQTRKRAQGTDVDSLGGYTIPVEVSSDFIDLLYAQTVMDKVNVTKIAGLKGIVAVNGLASGATAYWHGEGAAVSESEPTWLQKQMRPHELTSWVKVQNQLLVRSPEAIESRLRMVLARAAALKLDLAFLLGTGGAHQPRGIANTTGIQDFNMGANGDELTVEDFVDMENLLMDQNVPTEGAALVTHHKVIGQLKKQRIAQFSGDSGGTHVILPMNNQVLRDTIGYDFATTTQIPADLTKGTGTALSHLFFGQFAEFIAATWDTFSFDASTQASLASSSAWLQNQTWLKTTGAFDFGAYHPLAMVHSNEVKTTA